VGLTESVRLGFGLLGGIVEGDGVLGLGPVDMLLKLEMMLFEAVMMSLSPS
jgi:hypothetical protein